MHKRLIALVAALGVTFASFGGSALTNLDEHIAQLTQSIYNDHPHQEVVLAEEDHESYSGDTSDPCLDTNGNWICEDEDYWDESWDEDWEDYDYDEYEYDEEDYYEEYKEWEDECYDTAGNYLCDDDYEWEDEQHWEEEAWEEPDSDCFDTDSFYDCTGDYEDYYIDFDDSYDDHYDTQTDEISKMIAELEMKLMDLEIFLEEVHSMANGESASVTDSIEALEELIDGGFELLDAMLYNADQGLTDEEIYEFWDMIAYIRETADSHMRSVEDAFMIDGGFEFYEDEHYDDKYFEDYYGGDYHYDEFFKDFDYEDAEYVTQEVPDDLMYELVEHADNPYAQELATSVMNNLDVLDEDAVTFLEYSAELFDVMDDVEVPDDNDPKYDRLKDLYEKSFVLLTEEVRADIISTWTAVKSAVEAGASETTLNDFAEQIEALLKENTETLVLEEGIGYFDVALEDDDWYFDDVQELKDEGIIGGFKDEHGEATGYFGPSELITKAEMLKLVLEVSQRGQASFSPSDSSAHGQWYEGYVAQFENMGMSYGGNWNEPITRRVAAVWISEAMELHEKVDNYDGEFGDVSAADDDAIHFAAVYEYGVFTGDSGTGNLRAEDNMNRAEAAKVVRTAMSEVLDRAADSVNDTIDSFMDSYSY